MTYNSTYIGSGQSYARTQPVVTTASAAKASTVGVRTAQAPASSQYTPGQLVSYFSKEKSNWFDAIVVNVDARGVEVAVEPGQVQRAVPSYEIAQRLKPRQVLPTSVASMPAPVGYPLPNSPTGYSQSNAAQTLAPQVQTTPQLRATILESPTALPTTLLPTSPKGSPTLRPTGSPTLRPTPTGSPTLRPTSSPSLVRPTPTGSPTLHPTTPQLSTPTVRATILERQVSKPVAAVEYFSNSCGRWIPGVFEGFNEAFGTYTLDVQPFARPGDVRLAPGAAVEYFSNSKGAWVPAEVINFNDELGVYTLDVQPYARPEVVRLKGFEECLDPPHGKYEELLAPAPAEIQAPAEVALSSTIGLTPSDQIPVNSLVEYFSTSKGDWIPALVSGFDDEKSSYSLDVRSTALACNIRVPVDAEKELEAEVPQFKVEKYKVAGEVAGFAVFLEASNGAKIKAFDEDVVAFELSCKAEALQAWLEGMTLQMIPGLLTFLQEDASAKHERLEALRQEKESYRGSLDYGFFGLDEEKCTDKDIDRAYRKAARELHPDKGGDEAAFNEMQRMYEEIKTMREEKDPEKEVTKETKEGDATSWDPTDRESMMKAHETMRAFLLWVSNDIKTVTEELEELRRRYQAANLVKGSLEDVAKAPKASEVMATA